MTDSLTLPIREQVLVQFGDVEPTQAETKSCDVIAEANAIRLDAGKLHRHSDITLYKLLARCLALCERDATDIEALRLAYGREAREATGRRVYIERGSDAPQVVCRYVLREDEHRANVNRYAFALREAQKRQISSTDLVEWLANNGGVNALYLARPLDQEYVATRTLRLDRQIATHKSQPFSLKLIRLPDNTFKVLEFAHV